MRPGFYWFRFRRDGGLPVSFPALSPKARNYRWTGLYGIQIGEWFIGAVRGRVDVPSPVEVCTKEDRP